VWRVQPGHDRAVIQRQIDATDHQIDQLVYQLYGLSDQENTLIEDSTSDPKAATMKAGE
jgi:hypothetical protein